MVLNFQKHSEFALFELLSQLGKEENQQIFLVGGFVRDLLLHRKCKDADILVVGSGIDFATKAHKRMNTGKFSYFKNFGTANIQLKDGFEIEFVGARKESYQRDSRNPIVEEGSFNDDISR